MTHPRILVTGATGVTGGALVKVLQDHAVPATALVRSPEKASDLVTKTTRIVQGDLSDIDSLRTALTDIDAAYLNVLPGEDTLQQVDNFVQAAREAGVKHIVKLSGVNAKPDSAAAIIRVHAEADRRVMESGITYTILQANSFFQNMLSQLESIRSDGVFYSPMGDARQSFIDVADIAEVAMKRLTQTRPADAVLKLTGPASLSMADMAKAFGDVLGRDVQYVAISLDAFQDNLLKAGMPEPVARNLTELFSVFATGIYADVSEDVQTTLGRAPTSVEDFAKKAAQM